MGTGLSKDPSPPPLDAQGQEMLPFSFFYPSRKVIEITAPGSTAVLFTFRKQKGLHHDWRLYTGQPPVASDGVVQEPHLLQVEPRGLFKGGMKVTAGSPLHGNVSNSLMVNDLLPSRHGWAFHVNGDNFLWREPHGRQEWQTHGRRRCLLCFRTSADSKLEYDLVGAVEVGVRSRDKAGVLWLAPAVVEPFVTGGVLRLFELLVATGVTSLQLLLQRRAANSSAAASAAASSAASSC